MSRPISIEYLDEIQLGFIQHDVDAILSHFATRKVAELCQDCGISGKISNRGVTALYAFKSGGFGGEIGVVTAVILFRAF